MGALTGIRVVDLTRILAGPICTQLLADMGAEVIKIEPPDGDPVRRQGAVVDGYSWYFAQFNRNKKSVVLDLYTDAGKDALARLIATADEIGRAPSELQSLMRISYAGLCWKKNNKTI